LSNIDPIEQSSKRIKELCAKCGVAVAFIPEMKKVPWNGAKSLNVSPGIVAGRYRKLTGKWAWFNELTNKPRWKTEDC